MKFYKETDFRQEPIIGKVPEDWAITRLEDALTLLRNGLTIQQNKHGDGYPITRIETISEEKIDPSKVGYVDGLDEQELNEFRIIDGDILFSHINSLEHIGKTAIYEGIPELLIHGMNLLLLRPDKNKVHPKFLLYLLRLYRKRNIFRAMAKKAVNQASINQTELGRIKIYVPPLEEQRAIVGVLGVVDSAIDLVDRVILKTERLKKGLMQTLLTRGIGHKEYKQTPIGTIPKKWEITRLKDIASIKEGVYGKRGEKGIIQLKADSILDSGRINVNAYALISVDKKIDDYLLEPGDVILSNRNSAELVGKCAIFRGEFNKCVFSNLLTRIRLNSKNVLPEWLLYILTKMKSDGLLRAFSTRAVNQVLLKKELVENLKVPIPSISEQQEIVNILSAIDDKLELEKKEKGKLEKIKRGLMDLLLTGKIRVKVGEYAFRSG